MLGTYIQRSTVGDIVVRIPRHARLGGQLAGPGGSGRIGARVAFGRGTARGVAALVRVDGGEAVADLDAAGTFAAVAGYGVLDAALRFERSAHEVPLFFGLVK